MDKSVQLTYFTAFWWGVPVMKRCHEKMPTAFDRARATVFEVSVW